mmetsp:Transcript_23860/g.67931  ORF Transcript_23860/g.67931 Transcript_23860/m.67931 type:complete len:234 (+) Transcript_23860:2-703(+)
MGGNGAIVGIGASGSARFAHAHVAVVTPPVCDEEMAQDLHLAAQQKVCPFTPELLRPSHAGPSSQPWLTTFPPDDDGVGAIGGIGAMDGMGAIDGMGAMVGIAGAPSADPAPEQTHVAVMTSPVCEDDTAQDSHPAAQQKLYPLMEELLRPAHTGPSSQPWLWTSPALGGAGIGAMGGNGAIVGIGAMGGMGAMVGIGAIVGMGGMGAIRGMGDGTPCASPAPPMQTHVAVME